MFAARVSTFGFALLLAASPAGGQSPPPIPSGAHRAAFLTAKQDAAMRAREAAAARAVHDEYDVAHYDIHLDLDIPQHILTGTVTLEATAEIANLSDVALDLYDCMEVDAVSVDGTPAGHTHAGGILTIDLGSVHQVGDPFTVSCDYHGIPSFSGSPFRWQVQNGVPMVLSYSEPWGAPAWWLCKDDPKDKATYGIHLTVPDTLVAVSNGGLDSVTVTGSDVVTYHWSTAYPMSPYLFSIAVTDFESWSETYTALDDVTTMEVTYWVYPTDLEDAQESWNRNIEMMEYYASLFGEYPFLDDKYGIAEFQHPGAMEHQTCTSMGSAWVTGNHVYDWIVAHELSHSWVGDMITMTEWSHAWCKEGFATYCEALYFEDKYGEHYYHNYMNRMDVMDYAHRQVYDSDPPLHGTIYYKGAWVLHMLRHVIGDEAFFDAVYAYTNEPDFRYDVADTEDLREVFEAASGTDLRWFFDQWVYHPGYPAYQLSWWWSETREGYDATVKIEQVQSVDWPIFKMPIDIVIDTESGTESFVVIDSLASQTFTLSVSDLPLDLRMDPEHWIIRGLELMDVVEGMPHLALGAARPNPFTFRTTLDYQLPGGIPLRAEILDLNGRRVASLPRGEGRLVWDGTDAAGHPVAAGVYYCRLRTPAWEESRHLLLIR